MRLYLRLYRSIRLYGFRRILSAVGLLRNTRSIFLFAYRCNFLLLVDNVSFLSLKEQPQDFLFQWLSPVMKQGEMLNIVLTQGRTRLYWQVHDAERSLRMVTPYLAGWVNLLISSKGSSKILVIICHLIPSWGPLTSLCTLTKSLCHRFMSACKQIWVFKREYV